MMQCIGWFGWTGRLPPSLDRWAHTGPVTKFIGSYLYIVDCRIGILRRWWESICFRLIIFLDEIFVISIINLMILMEEHFHWELKDDVLWTIHRSSSSGPWKAGRRHLEMIVFTLEEKTSIFLSDPSHPVVRWRAKPLVANISTCATGPWFLQSRWTESCKI